MQHSQTGIVRGAPSKSDDETEASPFQGIAYQFTRSEGGGFHRIPFVGRNQWQSADGSHFYECGIAVSGDAVTGIARLHQRVVGTDGDTFSVTGCKQDVEHAFSTVGHREHDGPAFGDKAEAYPKQLSGGQKQRVAIARALANDPNVLLCDEATSALDPQTTKAILRLLKNLNEKLGITVVIITHEMAVVKEICDRVAVMEHGRVVEQGEVFNVFADPRQEITRSFIHTTSNLRKIEELIEEDSPVVQLKPGELIVRLSYIQRNVSEPLISTVSRKFDITLNIIFSDIAIVQNAPIGGTVAIISGERAQITQAIAYLIEKNVGVEVIRDARISE